MPVEKLHPTFTFTEDRLRELQAVVPEAFADGQVNWATLREALGAYLEDEGPGTEHFGLFWPGKRQARRLAAQPSKGTLRPAPGEGVNEATTRNLFIEGDNLEVLKLLQKSYAGRVKLIYIDPPYNTGNDFVYKDDFREPLEDYLQKTGQADAEGLLTSNPKAGGRFHSNWLNMMLPRLMLARTLLSEDGVIIIHIDEHEYANLLLIANETFGEENDLGSIVWDKKNPKGDATGISYQHETIVIFSKSRQFLEKSDIKRPKRNAEVIINKSRELFSKIGKNEVPNDLKKVVYQYKLLLNINQYTRKVTLEHINLEFSEWIKKQDFSGGEAAYSQIDENGDVYRPVSMAWPNKKKAPDDYFIPLIHPITKKPCPVPKRGWRNPQKTMQKLLQDGQIIFGPDEKTQPCRKYLLKENMFENLPSLLYFGGSDDVLLNNLEIPFDNPKPVEIAKQIVRVFSKPQNIIIDFFSGSCTTAQAVLELNREDNGNRRFIMVQMPEPTPPDSSARQAGYQTIADIGKERIRRVIKKLADSPQAELIAKRDTPEDLGFAVYQLDRSHFKAWQDYDGPPDPAALDDLFSRFETPLVDGWQPRALLDEVLLQQGFPLDSRRTRCKDYPSNAVVQVDCEWFSFRLFVCLDDTLRADTIAALRLNPDDKFVCLDSALTDQTKQQLADRCTLVVI